MPGWYYDKKELRNTPSAQDGIDYKTEMRYRKEACCCLFLAGKVEETPKKCKDIIKTARGLLTEQKFTTFGEDPKEEMKKTVMTLERILLQTIKFDLQVEHPYQYLLKYAKCLKGDKVKLQKMVQMAWTFVNDSLCTTLALQWEPEIIAVALMYLAGKLSKFEVVDWIGRSPKHLRWWDMFVEDVTMDLLEDICHQKKNYQGWLFSFSSHTGYLKGRDPITHKINTECFQNEYSIYILKQTQALHLIALHRHFKSQGQATPANPVKTSNGQEKSHSPDQPLPINIKIPPPSPPMCHHFLIRHLQELHLL
ncbi:hypothetical protein NQ317_018352 [Molorchus minor]|uniref:Cyclin-K n=1 Tax=Molorchus minor TaxID=1323400 RepID=A0ABQ9JHD1_9CUCU|nr:hypothetical protein NQ317_018352 [Molorchus minor]